MRTIFGITLIAGMLAICITGCDEQTKSSTTKEMKIETPGGTTTITTEKEVKTSDDTPPATKP